MFPQVRPEHSAPEGKKVWSVLLFPHCQRHTHTPVISQWLLALPVTFMTPTPTTSLPIWPIRWVEKRCFSCSACKIILHPLTCKFSNIIWDSLFQNQVVNRCISLGYCVKIDQKPGHKIMVPIKSQTVGPVTTPLSGHSCVSWSSFCFPTVHAEEEPSLQRAEGGDCLVHGSIQHLRQWQAQCCQGPA